MDKDICWELFTDTGDVSAWLLYRAAQRWDDENGKKTREQEAENASAPD